MRVLHGERPTEAFTRVPNAWLRDKRLSAKAKGILAYLLSHEHGYDLSMEQLVAESSDGAKAMYSGINELVEAGYVRRDAHRDDSGRVTAHLILVLGADGQFAQVTTTSPNQANGPASANPEFPQVSTTSPLTASSSAASSKRATKKNMAKKTTNPEDQQNINMDGHHQDPDDPTRQQPAAAAPDRERRLANLITEVRRRRPRWDASGLRSNITRALAAGRPWDGIAYRMPLLADDLAFDTPAAIQFDSVWSLRRWCHSCRGTGTTATGYCTCVPELPNRQPAQQRHPVWQQTPADSPDWDEAI